MTQLEVFFFFFGFVEQKRQKRDVFHPSIKQCSIQCSDGCRVPFSWHRPPADTVCLKRPWVVDSVPPPHTPRFVSTEYTVDARTGNTLRQNVSNGVGKRSKTCLFSAGHYFPITALCFVNISSPNAGYGYLNIKYLIKEIKFPAVCCPDTLVCQDFPEQSLYVDNVLHSF